MSNTSGWYCSYLSLCMQHARYASDVSDYSSKWRFTFSSPKRQIINFSRERDAGFSLYNKQLPKTTSIKHVGIKLQANFDHWERTAETCKSIKSTSMAFMQFGCHPHGLSPVTSLKVVKTLCLAKSLYGCELWNALSKNELLALERVFRLSIKNIQGLPKRTRTNICLGLTGTTSIESIIDMHKLYFLGHLLRTPTWDISIQSGNKSVKCVQTAVVFITEIMCKYQLLNHLTEFFNTSIFQLKNTWKLIIKKSVFVFEESKWQYKYYPLPVFVTS